MSKEAAPKASGSSTPSWFAVFSKPRQEHTARDHLERQGFRCFLPLAVNPQQRRSRRGPRIEPLFPRYLFLQAKPALQNLAVVRSTRGAVGLVRSGMDPLRVSESIIQGLEARRDPDSGLVQLNPIPVEPGDRVRVFDGPFAGLTGILKEHNGERRAQLLLSLLGRETTVEVDTLLLQRAG